MPYPQYIHYMENQSARQTDKSVLDRTLGVAANRQTYKNLLYLLTRFPLGIAYLVVFVTGLSLGMATVPLLVGVPILAGVLGVAGYVGVVEAALLRIFFDRDVTWSPIDPHTTPVVPYLKQVATEPKNYLLVVLAFVSFITGCSCSWVHVVAQSRRCPGSLLDGRPPVFQL
jgi:hypothetical protein